MKQQFLKCDAVNCDHVETHDQLTVDMVNKPCPKCGANLLNDRDWADFLAFSALINGAADSATEADDKALVSFGMHNGNFDLSIRPIRAAIRKGEE